MTNLDKNYINKFKIPDANTLVMFNGNYQPELSSQSNEFTLTDQTLTIHKNSKIKKPIHLLVLTSKNCDYKINIVLEENSNCTIVEEHINQENHKYTSYLKINIVAKNSSKTTYYKLQNENNATCNTQTTIKQEQKSEFIHGFVGKDTKISNDTLHVELTEENANYNAIGIISLQGSQNLNYQTRIEHLAPKCTSNVFFKGIIKDQAKGSFNCLVVAHPNATNTETHVTNKNLLLSESAAMETSPELEIYTDDVICTHGATVGQLDQEALFYLRSRGIEENKAAQILTTAFVQEIVDRFAGFCHKKMSITKHEPVAASFSLLV